MRQLLPILLVYERLFQLSFTVNQLHTREAHHSMLVSSFVQALQEKIKSDEVPTSIMAYGEEIANEPSISRDQKSKVKLQMAEIKKEIGKLSDRTETAKHRYCACRTIKITTTSN